jgi:hypothetical protein
MDEERQRCEECVFYDQTDDNTGMCHEFIESTDGFLDGEFCDSFQPR